MTMEALGNSMATQNKTDVTGSHLNQTNNKTTHETGKNTTSTTAKNNNHSSHSTNDDDAGSSYPAEFRQQVYQHVSKYAVASWSTGAWNVFSTFALIFAYHIFLSTQQQYYMVLFYGLLKVRCFMLFHDAGHNNYFPSTRANFIFGTLLGPIASTPFGFWVKGHNHHHKHSNNLNRKQYSQTAPWTVKQYEQASNLYKILYTLFYGPVTLWTVVPAFLFGVLMRLQSSFTDFCLIVVYYIALYLSNGVDAFIIDTISMAIAAYLGVFLFSIQHTFDGVYKRKEKEWNYFDNGMQGCSFFLVPQFLKYFTLGIEYHHIHHLNARVPCYRIQQCHEDAQYTLFKDVPKLSVWQAIKTMPYSLYNEDNELFETAYSHFDISTKTA